MSAVMTTPNPTDIRLKLYEYPAAFQALLDQVDADPAMADGEITPALAEAMDALELSFTAKVDAVATYILQLGREAEAIATEVGRLATLSKARLSRVAWLKGYLMAAMQSTGHTHVDTLRHKVRIQNNSQDTIEWLAPVAELPLDFQRMTITPDLMHAKEVLKQGGTLPSGFSVKRGQHLRIT